MKKITGWMALTIAAYLIALLALLPARYVIDDLVPQFGINRGNEWALYGISGTIWSGEVEQLSHQGREVGKVTWEMHPLSLIAGNLALRWKLKSQSGELHGESTFNSSGEILVEDIRGEIPVEELTVLLPFVPFVVNGTLTLDLSELKIEGGKPRLMKGEIYWKRAVIVAMQKIDFGDVTVTFDTSADNGEVDAQLNNQQGALAVNATATVKASGEYQLKGELTTRTKKDRALLNSFIMLGRPDQSGRLHFSQIGRL